MILLTQDHKRQGEKDTETENKKDIYQYSHDDCPHGKTKESI